MIFIGRSCIFDAYDALIRYFNYWPFPAWREAIRELAYEKEWQWCQELHNPVVRFVFYMMCFH